MPESDSKNRDAEPAAALAADMAAPQAALSSMATGPELPPAVSQRPKLSLVALFSPLPEHVIDRARRELHGIGLTVVKAPSELVLGNEHVTNLLSFLRSNPEKHGFCPIFQEPPRGGRGAAQPGDGTRCANVQLLPHYIPL